MNAKLPVAWILAFAGLLACAESDPPDRAAQEVAVPEVALPAAFDWNDAEIEWLSYEAGLARARELDKPILAVVYADWCHHCKNYSENFKIAEVLDRTRDYVMVRVNQDREPLADAALSPDGTYVPRTLVLSPDGTIRMDIAASESRFRFFYDYRDPQQLIRSLERALLPEGSPAPSSSTTPRAPLESLQSASRGASTSS